MYYLPPGHRLVVSPEQVERREYCDLVPRAPIRYQEPGAYADHFRELVTEAVRCRLRATGGIGISLSGGLDSTFLAAITARLIADQPAAPDLTCYSYAFERHIECDERQYIEPLVTQLGLKSRYIWCDDLWTFRDIDRWPVHRDFVLSDPYAWLPQAVMNAAQQDGCRVLLGGYYGDVLTVGGRYWAAAMLAENRFADLAHELWAQRRHVSWPRELLNAARPMAPLWLKRVRCKLRGGNQRRVQRGLSRALMKRVDLEARHARYEREVSHIPPAIQGFYRHLRLGCFSQGLDSVRRQYNQFGLEVLSPYEDRRLVEFVLAIPPDQLGKPGPRRDRWIHREAAKGLLPESVRSRTKRTIFFSLMQEGLFDKEREAVAALLMEPRTVALGYVEGAWLDQHPPAVTLPLEDVEFLWLSLCLELWLRRFW